MKDSRSHLSRAKWQPTRWIQIYEFKNWTEDHKVQLGWNSHTTNIDKPEHFIFTNRKGRQIGESKIIGVEGDQNVTPQLLIEEDDDLYEQDVVDKELAAQLTEYEDHMKADLNQELTTESPFEEISDQQQENMVK